MRDHLELFLKEEGYRVATARRRRRRAGLVATRRTLPDLVLADYNLPNGMNGRQARRAAARELRPRSPGHHPDRRHLDRDAARHRAHDCVQFNKPVKLQELTQAIDKLAGRCRIGRAAARAAPRERRRCRTADDLRRRR